MESKNRQPRWIKEIPEFASTETREGVLVKVRCYQVTAPEPARYEILLEGHGQHAITDVPENQRDALRARIDEAVDGFIATVRLRAGVFA